MKQMKYVNERYKEPLVLEKGFYKGYQFCVVSYGTHPCAYVAISEGQPYYNTYDSQDIHINCHGGITFWNFGFAKIFSSNYAVMGWDYHHTGDFIVWGTPMHQRELVKMWTTEEMVEECKNVIEQLYILERPELYYK